MGMFILCCVFGQLSSVKRLAEPMLLQNICSDASRVQDCWNLAKTRVTTKNICPAPKCCIFRLLVSYLYMAGAKTLKQ